MQMMNSRGSKDVRSVRPVQAHMAWVLALVLALSLLTWLVGSKPAQGAPSYAAYADSGMAALNAWYNSSNGQWNTTGWWNSANVLTALVDYSRRTGSTTY